MQWFVLLEADRGCEGEEFDASDLRKLLAALPDPPPGALHSGDRYALQLEVEAPGPSEAVVLAVRGLDEALKEVSLPRWGLVRAEALTRDEFEHECLLYDQPTDHDPLWPPQRATGRGERRGVEETLLREVFHDPLTDVASQGLFRDDLEHALAGTRPVDERCALLLLDVDRFGDVNERFGTRGGDSVLVSIARRVAKEVGRTGTVGRMGADQFGVLVDVAQTEEARSAASRIIDAVAAPIVVEGTDLRISVSVGIALGAPGDRGDDLLARATRALRTAQERGGARCEVFSSEMVNADVARLQAEREAMTSPGHDGYMALLERLSLSIEQSGTLEDAGDAVVRHVCETAGFPFGRLYVPEDGEDRDPLSSARATGGGPERLGAFGDASARRPLRTGDGVAARALAAGSAICVGDVACEPDLAVPEEAIAAGLRGAVAVPVVIDAGAVGVLEFFTDEAVESSDTLRQLLNTIAAQLASVARRARAEAAHARAETRLRVLLENSGAYLKILGPDGEVREQYPVTWTENALFPVNAIHNVHPDDLAVAVKGWADALASGGPHPPFEIRVRTAEGSWRWVEVTTNNMLDVPDVAGIVTCALDIDDRKRSEEARGQAEARLRQAQAAARLGTWQVDLVTGDVEWSDQLYRILGLRAGEAAPGFGSLLAVAHPDDRSMLEEHRRVLESGAGQHLLFRVCDAWGGVRWVSGHASAVHDRTGHVVALQGTLQDITEVRQLKEAIAESEQRLREVEAFAGIGSWRTDTAVEAPDAGRSSSTSST